MRKLWHRVKGLALGYSTNRCEGQDLIRGSVAPGPLLLTYYTTGHLSMVTKGECKKEGTRE